MAPGSPPPAASPRRALTSSSIFANPTFKRPGRCVISEIIGRQQGPDSSTRAITPGASLLPEAGSQAAPRLGTPNGGVRAETRISASTGSYGWSGVVDPAVEQRRLLDRSLNITLVGALGVLGAAKLLNTESGVWDLYQQAVATSPIEAKACISGIVYSLGDLIAQGYEGRDAADWDRGRIFRSGVCGLLAHGPLSHLYYVGLDHFFTQQVLIPGDSWAVPLLKVAVDQTAWSLLWNSSYYVLLGALKFESPATIAQTVRNSWWDLLKAGWRLWPLVHIFTYGVIPVQHRLLFVDAVELVWVSILSAYAQQQRLKAEGGDAPAVVACALPGVDGEGGDAAEQILRGMRVEREIVFEDALGNRTVASPEEVYAAARASSTDTA